MAPSKNKDNICYPEVFTGKIGENVHKFLAEFKIAAEADHIRTKDKVKTLLKYLSGDAKTSVGMHTLTLEEAFDILTTTYGNPSLIWNKIKENIFNSLGKLSSWGKPESVERRNALTKLIDFINEMKVLATEHVQLMPEIYNQATVKHIYNMTPKNIKDDLCKIVCDGTLDQIFDNIMKVLKEHRKENLSRITMEEKPNEIKPSPKKPFANSVEKNGKHNCEKNFQCKSEWGIFGCVELYKIKKIADRFSLTRLGCFYVTAILS